MAPSISRRNTTKRGTRLLAVRKCTWMLISNMGLVTTDTWTLREGGVAEDAVGVAEDVVVEVAEMEAEMVEMLLLGMTHPWKVEDLEEVLVAPLLTILESHWRMILNFRLC